MKSISVLSVMYSVLISALVFGSSTVAAVTINFTGGPANLGPGATNFGGILAEAFNSGGGIANLVQRNQDPTDHGLGVCNGVDDGGLGTCSSTLSGNGVNNEIDNNGSTYDYISLNVTGIANHRITSIGLSSVDGDDDDDWSIWGSNDAVFSGGDAKIAFDANPIGPVEPTIAINGADQLFNYYFVTTNDLFGEGDGSDFLLRSVTVVPIPAALPLFASALFGLGYLARRKKKDVIAA